MEQLLYKLVQQICGEVAISHYRSKEDAIRVERATKPLKVRLCVPPGKVKAGISKFES